MPIVAAEPGVVLLATERKVFGFDLMETFRISLGRHESNDLTFNSRNVSNYHAEILVEDDALVIHDLGSTNGSFVNEDRVKRRGLAHGDRIRIGSHEITVRLEGGDDITEAVDLAPTTHGTFRREGSDHMGPTLKEVLLGLCRHRVSVRMRLDSGRGDCVLVHIHEGYVFSAQHESGGPQGEKALYRAFCWGRGAFSTDPLPPDEPVSRVMSSPVETLVAEGEQQAADLDLLIPKLPPADATLRLREGSNVRICDFNPVELEVFQAVIRHGSLAAVLEGTEMTDLKAMTQVFALIDKSVFEVDDSDSLLEQTNVLPRL